MNKRSLGEFIQDILEAIEEIEYFTQGISYDEFQEQREKILAVVKLLEIIGEATKQVPEYLRVKYNRVPWKSIAGMRDILVHEYWDIDIGVVWATVTEYLPELKATVKQILMDSMNNEQ